MGLPKQPQADHDDYAAAAQALANEHSDPTTGTIGAIPEELLAAAVELGIAAAINDPGFGQH